MVCFTAFLSNFAELRVTNYYLQIYVGLCLPKAISKINRLKAMLRLCLEAVLGPSILNRDWDCDCCEEGKRILE